MKSLEYPKVKRMLQKTQVSTRWWATRPRSLRSSRPSTLIGPVLSYRYSKPRPEPKPRNRSRLCYWLKTSRIDSKYKEKWKWPERSQWTRDANGRPTQSGSWFVVIPWWTWSTQLILFSFNQAQMSGNDKNFNPHLADWIALWLSEWFFHSKQFSRFRGLISLICWPYHIFWRVQRVNSLSRNSKATHLLSVPYIINDSNMWHLPAF